jgi:hypothetical protein
VARRRRFFDPVPLACRLGFHRWEWTTVRTKRCTRPGCIAIHASSLSDPLSHLFIPPTDGLDYWVTCWRWDGEVLYAGPCPIPKGIDELSKDDLRLRRFNRYEVVPVELSEPG